ncbi:MAG: hypothetical protein ABUS51_05510 [Acidobacteriota bacterium]
MPIALGQPPAAVAELTRARIREIARQGNFRVAALAQAAPDSIDVASGHPVYNLGLDEVVAGKPLTDVPLNAWRFLVKSNREEHAAAETLQAGAAGGPEFSSVNSGPFVTGTADAFTALFRDPAFTAGDWEGRLLRIPALYIFAVWAHDKRGGDDRLRPVKPAPPYLDDSKTYTWKDFRDAILPAARQRLSMDDGLKG